MEPVFMALGESAAIQDVPYSDLRRELDAATQVLEIADMEYP
jgi:hypothetical protein